MHQVLRFNQQEDYNGRRKGYLRSLVGVHGASEAGLFCGISCSLVASLKAQNYM